MTFNTYLFLGCLIEDGIDYHGHDLPGKMKETANLQECAEYSASIAGGLFWTWAKDSKICYVKSSNSGREMQANRVSGNRACGIAGEKTF